MKDSRPRSDSKGEEVFKAKITIIGDTGCGKTSLISAFTSLIDNKDSSNPLGTLKNTRSTVGYDFITRSITTPNDNRIKLCIWDTAGQEKFRSLSRTFYFGSHGVILCFDLSKNVTEAEVLNWENEVSNNIDKACCKVLVGTKSDIADPESLVSKRMEQIAQKLELSYLETSALTGKNIKEIFDIIISEVERRHALYRNVPEGSLIYYQGRDSRSMSIVGNQNYDSGVSKSAKCC